MKTKLVTEQAEDVEKIANAIDLPNFSLPGSGKTYTTIGAIERMGMQTGIIVGPPIAMMMWKDVLEYELDGCRVQWLKHRDSELDPLADFYVVSYPTVPYHRNALIRGNYDCLVCDESHYLRTPYNQRSNAIFGPRNDGKSGIYEAAKQTWLLTGTPVERYADDLWSQLQPTHPAILKKYEVNSLYKFQQKFCRMQQKMYGKMKVPTLRSIGNINEPLLNRILYKEIGALRRKPSAELPQIRFREITVKCPLSGDLKEYMAGKSLADIEALLTSGGTDEGLIKARRLVGLGKLAESTDYIASVAKKQPVLVGYWHTDVGKELTARLDAKHLRVKRIGGDVTATKREEYRLAFNSGGLDVIVGQIQSMGVSMNLQEQGCYVIIAEDDWSAAKIEQFYKRVYRRGQQNDTQVDFLRCDYPVDVAIRKVRERKRAGIDGILTT